MKTIYIDDEFYDAALNQQNKRKLAQLTFAFISQYLNSEGFKCTQKAMWGVLKDVLSPIELPKERTLKMIAQEEKRQSAIAKLNINKKLYFLAIDPVDIQAKHQFGTLTNDLHKLTIAINKDNQRLVARLYRESIVEIKQIEPDNKSVKLPNRNHLILLNVLVESCSMKVAIDFVKLISGGNASYSSYRRWAKDVSKYNSDIKVLNHAEGDHIKLWYFKTTRYQVVSVRQLTSTREVELLLLTVPKESTRFFENHKKHHEKLTELSYQPSKREVRYGSIQMEVKHQLKRTVSNNHGYYKDKKINSSDT